MTDRVSSMVLKAHRQIAALTLDIEVQIQTAKVTALQSDLDTAETELQAATTDFTVKTNDGTRYLNLVRELYYSSLTTGIAPEKVGKVIKLVLQKLCPSVDTSNLK